MLRHAGEQQAREDHQELEDTPASLQLQVATVIRPTIVSALKGSVLGVLGQGIHSSELACCVSVLGVLGQGIHSSELACCVSVLGVLGRGIHSS